MKQMILVGMKEFEGDDGQLIQVEYYFTKDNRGDQDRTPLCGIQLIKWNKMKEAVEKEVEILPAISYSERFVRQILDKLMRNTVTPMQMTEVIDDLVSQESLIS